MYENDRNNTTAVVKIGTSHENSEARGSM